MGSEINSKTLKITRRLIELLFNEETDLLLEQNIDPNLPGAPRHCLDHLIVRTIQAVGGNYSEVMKELESYLKEDERIEHESYRDASGRLIRTIILHSASSPKPVSYRISTLKKRISELHNLLKPSWKLLGMIHGFDNFEHRKCFSLSKTGTLNDP